MKYQALIVIIIIGIMGNIWVVYDTKKLNNNPNGLYRMENPEIGYLPIILGVYLICLLLKLGSIG